LREGGERRGKGGYLKKKKFGTKKRKLTFEGGFPRRLRSRKVRIREREGPGKSKGGLLLRERGRGLLYQEVDPYNRGIVNPVWGKGLFRKVKRHALGSREKKNL